MVEDRSEFSAINVLNWRVERVFSVIAAVLIALSMIRDAEFGFNFLWIIPLVLSSLAALASFYYPEKLSQMSAAMYILICCAVFIGNIYRNHYFININMDMPMFNVYKLVAIAIALLAPRPNWIGFFIITLCLFIPPLQVLFLSPEFNMTKYGEQWMPMFYSILAYFILDYRIRAQDRYAEIIKTNISEKTLSDFMEISIELRDQTRKSIKSLQMIAEMMDNEKHTGADVSAHLKQSVREMTEILRIFDEARGRLSNSKSTLFREHK